MSDAAATSGLHLKRWRREVRRKLLTRRTALDRATRERLKGMLSEHIRAGFPDLHTHTVGFYWPIEGEPDMRNLMRGLIDRGATAGVPVVVAKGEPVEFWQWTPRTRMEPGDWNIPQPRQRVPIRPTALLVPLVGFAGLYRLGYGAGYYDRTLAALNPKPLCIGVGLEMGRLPTIRPQPHDIPMDAIVTELGVVARGAGSG